MRHWKGTGKDASLSIVSLHCIDRADVAAQRKFFRRIGGASHQLGKARGLSAFAPEGIVEHGIILAEGAGWKRLLVVGRWISFTIQPAKTHEPRRAQSITKVSSLTRLLRVRSWPLWLAISQIDPLPLQRIDKFYH